MSADSPIEWTDHTFNPWWGCTKISPGCDNCYAERLAARFGTAWGPSASRREFGESHWLDPIDWNRRAERQGVRKRVFTASMADIFDADAPEGVREMLWELVEQTPNLDWLLLTKRIGNAKRMLPAAWLALGGWPANARLGATLVNQPEWDRDIDKLLELRVPNFVSLEPLLGRIDLCETLGIWWNSTMQCFEASGPRVNPRQLDWVITGGESGPAARPSHPEWFRTLRDTCKAAGVPFLLKQHGEWLACESEASTDRPGRAVYLDEGYGVELEDGRRYKLAAEHGCEFVKVGKKTAGRLLDGAQHDGFPR